MTLLLLLTALRAGATPAERRLLVSAYIEHATARRRRRAELVIARANYVPEAYACR